MRELSAIVNLDNIFNCLRKKRIKADRIPQKQGLKTQGDE
jgi:hypothetical protein